MPPRLSAPNISPQILAPTRSLSEPSLPLRKKNFQLQKNSQGLAPKEVPFRALSPKFRSNCPPTSTPHPHSPPRGAPADSAQSPLGAPTPTPGQAAPPAALPRSHPRASASRAARPPPPHRPFTSGTPARAPARRRVRRSAPGVRRLLGLPGTDNEGRGLCGDVSVMWAGHGLGAWTAFGPSPFSFRPVPFPGLGLCQVFIACLARCPGPVLGAMGNRSGRKDALLSRGAFPGEL